MSSSSVAQSHSSSPTHEVHLFISQPTMQQLRRFKTSQIFEPTLLRSGVRLDDEALTLHHYKYLPKNSNTTTTSSSDDSINEEHDCHYQEHLVEKNMLPLSRIDLSSYSNRPAIFKNIFWQCGIEYFWDCDQPDNRHFNHDYCLPIAESIVERMFSDHQDGDEQHQEQQKQSAVITWGQSRSSALIGNVDHHEGVLPLVLKLCYEKMDVLNSSSSERKENDDDDDSVEQTIKYESDSSRRYRLEIKCYEVYAERIYDLFEKNRNWNTKSENAKMRILPETGDVFVEGITTATPENLAKALKYVERGVQEKSSRMTMMSIINSRSSLVFELHLHHHQPSPSTSLPPSRAIFVDSPHTDRIKPRNDGYQPSERQHQEDSKLHLFASRFRKCVDVCIENQEQQEANREKESPAKTKKQFEMPPVRESCVTWLLQSVFTRSHDTKLYFLSGIFATESEVEESKRTLDLAEKISRLR